MNKKPIFTSLICSTFEWYDYALYGQFSYLMGKLFFPSSNPQLQMISAFCVFCAGYLTRPIGGVIFGLIGDKYGRSKALSISIFLMAIPTTCIGLLPTYADAGIIAPIILTFIRMLQGISMGGMNGAFIFVIEHAPNNKKGLYSSLAFMTSCIGIAIGSAIAAGMSNLLPPEQFELYGWRIAFFLSFFMGIFAYLMKGNLIEAEIYLKAKIEKTNIDPIKEITKNYKLKIIQAMGINITMVIPYIVLLIFINSFMISSLHFTAKTALSINFINIFIITIVIPISGYLSDKFGNNKVMLVSSIMIMLLIYPISSGINSIHPNISALYQFALAALIGMYSGPLYSLLIELFPVMIRYTSLGLAMNFSATVFGSTLPLLASYILKNNGINSTINFISCYIMICSLISTICLIFTSRKK
jgi:MHS family proline/betaine transporter-like MFS transporter